MMYRLDVASYGVLTAECRFLFIPQSFSFFDSDQLCCIAFLSGILAMRTWALWGRARMVTVILGILLLVSSDAPVSRLRMLIALRPLFL